MSFPADDRKPTREEEIAFLEAKQALLDARKSGQPVPSVVVQLQRRKPSTPPPVVVDQGETEDDGGAELDAYATLVAPGRYEVAFVSAEKTKLFGRFIWAADFKIISPGPGYERPIRGFASALAAGQRLSPSVTLVGWYSAATNLRPPKHLYRMHPREFLECRAFIARVKTVKHDRNRDERPAQLHYSRVASLLEQTAGPQTDGWRGKR